MDASFDIHDSSDWLSTPLSSLALVESALRCQEVKLRQNWAVGELVDSFKKARKGTLEFARNASKSVEEGFPEGITPKKRRIEELEGDVAQGTRRSLRRTTSQSRHQDDTVVIEDSEDDECQKNDGLVACPICHRRMKEVVVFSHLNNCPGPSSQNEPGQRKSFLHSNPRCERLPTINYSMMKDNVLRKKLRDMGLADSGPKPLLQRRHTEWLNLWNANCDSKNPKSKRELLRELEIWERSQGQASHLRTQTNTIMRKDFDGAAWSAAHGEDFKILIDNARKHHETRASSKDSEILPTGNDDNSRVSMVTRSEPLPKARGRSFDGKEGSNKSTVQDSTIESKNNMPTLNAEANPLLSKMRLPDRNPDLNFR
ncbi:E3 ubiquitin-protein ligase rad18 [Ophidiomyces ophidiicola]|nr:E3 ubiquitin-protein ligase rad18 [Ophidiomyces ophidiicola]